MTSSISNPSPLALDAGNDPFVTIAIPTYNRASLVRECVRSALAQSYQAFEVLVSDNASTDETQEVLKEFHDRRLRVIKQESNIGLNPNWNACLEEARGEYIVFVSDDDIISPWLLDRCVALARREPQIPVVVALSDVHFVAELRTWHAPPNQKLGTGIWDGADILQEYLEERISAPMCTIVIKTESLRARGGFPVDFPFAGDTIAWASLLLGAKAGFVNEPCGMVRVHGTNETSRLALDTRVTFLQRVVDLIISTADSSIENIRKRRSLQSAAKRYFARYAFEALASHRKGGTEFTELLRMMWRWRGYFGHIRMSDAARMAKPFAIIMLPAGVTHWFRNSSRTKRVEIG